MKRSIFMVLLSLGYLGAASGQQAAPTTAVNTQVAALRVNINRLLPEYNRSIKILATGLQQNWTADHFARKQLGVCAPGDPRLLLPRTIWDERLPFSVEVGQALERCRQQRDMLTELRDKIVPQ